MSDKTLLRVVVAAALSLLLWIGWRQVQPRQRLGDVPYVPTRAPIVDRMLELAAVDADDMVFDLGSGDGRIVIRAAQRYGARARGFELDPLLVRASRAAAVRAGVDDRVEFIAGDLFDADLAEATAVTLFLLPTVNLELRPRLLAQLAPGTPVVSHMWDMGEWRPDVHEVVALDPPADVYQWIIPAAVGGVWDVQLDEPGAAASRQVRLRLLQRFQDLEGELWYDERRVPLAGTVRGERFELAATRAHPTLGSFALNGAVIGTAMVAEAIAGAQQQPVAARGRRRATVVEGVWQVAAAARPQQAQWSLTLARNDWRWTARRRRIDTDALIADASRLPGIVPGGSDAAAGERHMHDVSVWGSSVAFVVDADDGSGRRVAYYGLVEGDVMSGFAHDGGTLVPWTARRREPSP